MSLHANQVSALSEAIALLQPLSQPADASLRAFFRRHAELGQRDRAFIAEGVYARLRRKRTLEAYAASSEARRLALNLLAGELGHSVRELAPVRNAHERKC